MAIESEWSRVVRETIERSYPMYLENLRMTLELEKKILSDPELAAVYMEIRARTIG